MSILNYQERTQEFVQEWGGFKGGQSTQLRPENYLETIDYTHSGEGGEDEPPLMYKPLLTTSRLNGGGFPEILLFFFNLKDCLGLVQPVSAILFPRLI